MDRTTKRWAITSGGLAAATLAAVVALAGPASATDSSTTGSPGPARSTASSAEGSTSPKFCEHVEKALDRRQRIADRWNGDASQHGSVAWLQARAATVGSKNPDLAKLLTDEAALRSQAKDPAATIIADLQTIQQARCSG